MSQSIGVDADDPPLRIFFGDGPLSIVTADYESRLKTWREWDQLSVAAHGKSKRAPRPTDALTPSPLLGSAAPGQLIVGAATWRPPAQRRNVGAPHR
jgi:hypothetical protein